MTKLVTVIYTEEVRGKGVEGDPMRAVPRLYTLDGQLICEIDPESPGSDYVDREALMSTPTRGLLLAQDQ